MASSKVMPSTSTSTNSDLNSLSSHPRHHLHQHLNNNHHKHNHNRNHSCSSSQMIPEFHSNNSNNNIDGILRDVYGDSSSVNNNTNANTLLDTEITLIDAAGAISAIEDSPGAIRGNSGSSKTAEEVWREIVNGKNERKECKVEALDEMMTLEDFLAKAGAGIEGEEGVELEGDVKVEVSGGGGGGGLFAGFDHGMVSSSYAAPAQMAVTVSMGYGNGSGGMEVVGGGVRGKRRGGPMLEPLDKAAQQRQRRMIKNRESAARSRERKQAYQVELESLAHKLEEENEQLLREKAQRMKERFKQLMEKVVPIEEKQRQPRLLRRVRSMQW